LSPGGGGGTAGDGSARDVPARPDGTPPFMGRLSEQTQCHDLPNTAPYISTLGHAGAARRLAGGVIADGRYELIQADFYPDGTNLLFPSVLRRTIELQQSATRLLITDFVLQTVIEAVDDRPSAAVTYVTDSNTLRATIDGCAGDRAAEEYQFEATPETVTMWSEKTRGLFLYLRVE